MTEISFEELLKNTNIQSHLQNLQSTDRENVKTALTTLAAIICHTKRKDALYALVGYYFLEVHNLDNIEFYFQATKNSQSPILLSIILEDLSNKKNASRRRMFNDEILRNLYGTLRNASAEQIEKLMKIIESSEWGEKQKVKYLNELQVILDRR